jgi:D-arabinose 1-dehydrogenase-like Zn-dependent alcohol dehydrogenase
MSYSSSVDTTEGPRPMKVTGSKGQGKVRVMTEIFPLEDITNAYDKVANGNVRFKAVIHPTN